MRIAILSFGIIAAALAGCGGGSGSIAPSTGGGGTQKNLAEATLRIIIPQKKTTSGKKRPAFISPSTSQLAWTLDGIPQQTISLTTSSSYCSGSPVTCNVPFYVAPGAHTFSFTLEDASGTALSQATNVSKTLVAGAATSLTVTLGGIAASFSVTSSQNSSPLAASLSTIYGKIPVTLTINAIDADGNTIVGTGAVAVAATLSPNPSASPPLATGTLTAGSGNTWTLTSTYSATSPTIPGGGLALYVSATPFPNSGGSTVSATYNLQFLDPWLVVSQSGAGKVTSYDEKGTAQTLSISGLSTPPAVVFGANSGTPSPLPSSYLYVAQVIPPNPTPTPTGSPSGSVGGYNADGTAASLSGSFSGVGVPVALAFDTNLNDLYVLNSIGTSLQAYSAQGTTTSVITSAPSISTPTGITFDSANNELYVTTASGVYAYAENGGSAGSVVSANSPSGVAYDANLNEIFVANKSNSTVSIYSPALVLQTSFSVVSSPLTIGFDPYAHIVYVGNSTSIQGYSESGTSLGLSFPALNGPSAITVVP